MAFKSFKALLIPVLLLTIFVSYFYLFAWLVGDQLKSIESSLQYVDEQLPDANEYQLYFLERFLVIKKGEIENSFLLRNHPLASQTLKEIDKRYDLVINKKEGIILMEKFK